MQPSVEIKNAVSMDNLPQKKNLVFLGLFYSFWKKKQLYFVEELFSI
jgi:hypothetical protein